MYVILAAIVLSVCPYERFNYALFRLVCQCFSSLGTHVWLLAQDSVVFVDIEPNVVAWSHGLWKRTPHGCAHRIQPCFYSMMLIQFYWITRVLDVASMVQWYDGDNPAQPYIMRLARSGICCGLKCQYLWTDQCLNPSETDVWLKFSARTHVFSDCCRAQRSDHVFM